MKKLNNKGFSPWEFVLLLLLLIALILAGWWVWQQNKSPKEDSNGTSNDSSKQETQTKDDDAKQTEATETKETKYLEIPELGIKMPLDDSTADAYYVVSDQDSNIVYLSLTSLKDIDYCAANKTSIAAIGKAKKTDEYTPGTTYEQAAQADGAVIGDYAYVLTPAQAYCTEQPDAKAKSIAARESFIKLAPTITQL